MFWYRRLGHTQAILLTTPPFAAGGLLGEEAS
jgi:hypothetical protein